MGEMSAYRYREKAFDEHGRECCIEGCLESGDVEVHHVDGDRTNNDAENLVPICVHHHKRVHGPPGRDYIDEIQLLRAQLPEDSFNTGPPTLDRETERIYITLWQSQVKWMDDNHIDRTSFIRDAVQQAINDRRGS